MRIVQRVFVCLAIAGAIATAQPAGATVVTLSRVLSASDWLNQTPTPAFVAGKVVLVDFYTFNCYNCQNVQPNLRTLYRTTSRNDLIILSVHSPETAVERDRDNVIASLKEQGVVWPVAIDNDFAIWNACGVTAWPTQMIFDRAGHLHKTIVGDSQDQAVDATVDQLIHQK